MKRRDVLTAAIAAPALAVPVVAEAKSETTVMRKYFEWKKSVDAWKADMERDDSDENGNRWCKLTYDLADSIVDIPSEGPMDFIYKLMAYTYHGEHDLSDTDGGSRLWAEARALVGEA